MPRCAVKNCKSSRTKGVRLFKLPSGIKNKSRRLTWEQYLNKENVAQHSQICELHFSDKQFELNRKDNRKLLKWNAIPDIQWTANESSKMQDNSSQNSELPTCQIHILDWQLPDCTVTMPKILEVYSEEPKRNENAKIETLKAELKAANRKISTLEKQLLTLEEKYKEIFNSDQINFLKFDSGRGTTWSDRTINKSLNLYLACGAKGYEEVRNQKLPYPSIRTLQNKIKEIKCKPEIEDVLDILEYK